MSIKNIAVFASGSGSNFIAIHNHIISGKIKGDIKLLISDNSTAGAVSYANRNRIPVFIIKRCEFSSYQGYTEMLLGQLKKIKIDLIVLAGFNIDRVCLLWFAANSYSSKD